MLENNRVLEKISHLIKTTQYGVVSIVIQDSKVIQIEKTEKFRVNKSDSKNERIKENFVQTDQAAGGSG